MANSQEVGNKYSEVPCTLQWIHLTNYILILYIYSTISKPESCHWNTSSCTEFSSSLGLHFYPPPGRVGRALLLGPVALTEPHYHWLLSTPSDTSSAGGERNLSLLTARWPSLTVLGGCLLSPGNTLLGRCLKPHLDSKGETYIIFSNSITAWEGEEGQVYSVVFGCSRKVIV